LKDTQLTGWILGSINLHSPADDTKKQIIKHLLNGRIMLVSTGAARAICMDRLSGNYPLGLLFFGTQSDDIQRFVFLCAAPSIIRITWTNNSMPKAHNMWWIKMAQDNKQSV
jgi:hypothetical protein